MNKTMHALIKLHHPIAFGKGGNRGELPKSRRPWILDTKESSVLV
jgi:hypothetical protein